MRAHNDFQVKQQVQVQMEGSYFAQKGQNKLIRMTHEETTYEDKNISIKGSHKKQQKCRIIDIYKLQIENLHENQSNFTVEESQKRSFQASQNMIKYALVEINLEIYNITERNFALNCNYAHFIVLILIIAIEIELTVGQSPKIQDSIKELISKLKRSDIKKQLKQRHYYDILTLVVRKSKVGVKNLHQFMINFMQEERQVMVAVFPYYFNLFALVVNKQVIFRGEDKSKWINYTFENSHCHEPVKISSRTDIIKVWKEVESLSRKMYNLEDED